MDLMIHHSRQPGHRSNHKRRDARNSNRFGPTSSLPCRALMDVDMPACRTGLAVSPRPLPMFLSTHLFSGGMLHPGETTRVDVLKSCGNILHRRWVCVTGFDVEPNHPERLCLTPMKYHENCRAHHEYDSYVRVLPTHNIPSSPTCAFRACISYSKVFERSRM